MPRTLQEAQALDAEDPLRSYRERFVIDDPDVIYLDGNSLGRLPRDTVGRVGDVLDRWASELVIAWQEGWLHSGLEIGDALAPLIGAGSGEVAVCDQTSVNLYKLATAALASSGRGDIVTDAGNFPSDRYVLDAVAAAAGGSLRIVAEDPDAATVAAALDDGVGLVSLTHVAYRSGALLDMEGITAATRDAGAHSLWDLAHSAGSAPVDLRAAGVDLAVGCTYKYLNAGPGAPGYLYVRRDLQTRLDPPIHGWFAHADQFAFSSEFVAAGDIRRFMVGTPPILSMVGVAVGVALVAEAGLDALVAKSRALSTGFLEDIAAAPIEVVSPRDPTARGSHVAVRHPAAWQVCQALRAKGIIVDYRAPDLIRFGFAPLYTTHVETWAAATALGAELATGAFTELPEQRTLVT